MQYILNFITSSFVRKNYWYIISSRIIICRFIYSFVSFSVKLFHESMQSSSIRRGLKIKQELLLETFYWSLHWDSYVFWTSDVIHRKHLGPVGESASVKNLSQVIYIYRKVLTVVKSDRDKLQIRQHASAVGMFLLITMPQSLSPFNYKSFNK